MNTLTAFALWGLIILGLVFRTSTSAQNNDIKQMGSLPSIQLRNANDEIHIQIVGSQFKWEFRYAGADNQLGKCNYKRIDEKKGNPLGQSWDDSLNHDDVFVSGEPLHLVVNRPVRMVTKSKDVLHEVDLIHFKIRMDVIPGMPTTILLTPSKTTKQMREDTANPNFNFEMVCSQMCGSGCKDMRSNIIIETQEEYDRYLSSKKPQYLQAKDVSD